MRPIDGDVLKRRAQKVATEAWKMKIEAKVETILNQFIDWINEAPTIQAEPHWIPCSERLPETTDAVLTTYIVNGDRSRRYVEESSCYGNDESWSSPWDEYRIAGTRIEVIAWMPMPVPWKGE